MANSIYDVHIAVLQTLDNELVRLHNALSFEHGDVDVTQEQITQVIEELARLSEQLGDAEIEK
jgi:DnaJ-domain-containing protein 1